MPYIYKYTDRSNIIRYVGIITSDSNFPGRFFQHKSDPWNLDDSVWKIEYSYYKKIADVDMIETYLINRHRKDLFNISKKDWGECSFIPEEYEKTIEWTVYKENSERVFKSCLAECGYDCDDVFEVLKNEILSFESDFNVKFKELRNTQNKIMHEMNLIDRSVSVFIKDNINEIKQELKDRYFVNATELYADYCDWMRVCKFKSKVDYASFKKMFVEYGFFFYKIGEIEIVLSKDIKRLMLSGGEISDFIERVWGTLNNDEIAI